MAKPGFIPEKYRHWIEARKQFRLTHIQVQMARELGLNPKKLGSIANHHQEPWKLPLPQFIEKIYFKHFKKTTPENKLSLEQQIKDLEKKNAAKKLRRAQAKSEELKLKEFQIRTANLEDTSAIDELLQESYPALMASSYPEALLTPALKGMTKANPSLIRSGRYYVAALPTGQVVGCGGWSLEQPGTGHLDPGKAHLRHFATHPIWTRHGIGKAIYCACESAARLVGTTSFECYSSLNAESFYATLGFTKIQEMEIKIQSGISLPTVLMHQILPVKE